MMKILVIRLGAFGDLIRCEGAFHDIRNAYPEAEIVLLTKRIFLEIGEKCPWIDRVIVDDSMGFFKTVAIFSLMKKRLREDYFDLVIDLHCSWRTNIYRKYFLTYCLGTPVKQKHLLDSSILANKYALMLNQVGINNTPNTLYPNLIWLAEDVSEYLIQYGIYNQPYILLFHSCSKKRHNIKKWPYFDDFVHTCKTLFPQYQLVSCIGPDDEPLHAHGVIYIYPKKHYHRCYLSFSELAGLIIKSSCVIGNDTGPTYLASFLGKRGICLFGAHRVKAQNTGIQLTQFSYIQKNQLSNISVKEVICQLEKILQEKEYKQTS